MKRLSELYPNRIKKDSKEDVWIQDIKINSKEVKVGDLFVCTKGVSADRHDYIEDAINHGASAIVVSRNVNCSVPVIQVEDTNKELPLVASRLYDHPEQKLKLIAITGTNGKTTVAGIIQDLLGSDECGYLGTNGIISSKFNEPIRNTTPDSDRLYKYFSRFVEAGCKYLSMETSSEAYFRNRLNNLEYEVGILTNITEDHLNVHKTIENYISCKKQMLKQVKRGGYCILNIDDSHYEECKSVCTENILTYGKKENATLQIIEVTPSETNTKITLKYQEKLYTVVSPLVGEVNAYNLCAAILATIALGKEFQTILKNISNIKKTKGRLEFLEYGQNYKIVLDYAHTPDAFLKIYPFLESIKKGKIITVTGSAGGREKEKRGPMGKIVLEHSDYVIFTMDDPREENVDDIIDDLVSISTNTNYERIINRKEAIYKALSMAKESDIILVTGKGIDNYMALGKEYLPYSDVSVIEEYFKENKGKRQ